MFTLVPWKHISEQIRVYCCNICFYKNVYLQLDCLLFGLLNHHIRFINFNLTETVQMIKKFYY